jgi:hypothetical protein
VQVASAGSSGGFLSNLFGSKSEDQGASARSAPAAEPAKPKSAAAPAKPAHTTVAAKKPEPSPSEAKTAVAAKPSPAKQEANAEQQGNTSTTSLLNGAAPTMPSGGFDSRFGAWR